VFFPNIEPKVVSVEITGPLGIGINSTDSALRILEEKILNMPDDKGDFVSVSTITGMRVAVMGEDPRPESHKGYIQVSFQDYDKRKVPSWTSMQWMEETLPPLLPGW